MRDSPFLAPFLVAAFLSLAMLAPPALAFDVDSSSNTNPDGSPRYADPDDKPMTGPLGAVTVGPSAGFTGGATTTSPSSIPQSWQDLGWANPLPDRRAK